MPARGPRPSGFRVTETAALGTGQAEGQGGGGGQIEGQEATGKLLGRRLQEPPAPGLRSASRDRIPGGRHR